MQKIAILYDASQAVLSTFDLDEVLQRILMIARDYFHLQNVAILLLDKDTRELHPRCVIGWDPGHDSIRLPLEQGITGSAARQKRPIYAPDVSKDANYVSTAKSTRSELAIPLMVRDEVVGVLDCQSENENHFDNDKIDLLTLFSTQASMALQNAHLYSLERQRAKQLEVINAIAQQTTAVLDQEELLAKVCGLIQQAFQVGHVSALGISYCDIYLHEVHSHPDRAVCHYILVLIRKRHRALGEHGGRCQTQREDSTTHRPQCTLTWPPTLQGSETMEPHGQDMLICSRLGSEVGTIAADPTALGQGKRWNRRDLTVPEMTPSDIKSQMFASGDLGGAQKRMGSWSNPERWVIFPAT